MICGLDLALQLYFVVHRVASVKMNCKLFFVLAVVFCVASLSWAGAPYIVRNRARKMLAGQQQKKQG